MVKKYNEIMKKLDAEDKQYLSKFLKIVNNQLSRNILAKMASPHSPICYENIPFYELGGGNSMQVMSTLRSMEEIGLASSVMMKSESGSFREYDVTLEGRALVDKHMSKELEKFSKS